MRPRLEHLDPGEQWQGFIEFCTAELAAGGPDAHMRYMGWMIRNEPLSERVWRVGLFGGIYTVPGAEVVWREWPAGTPLERPAEFASWLRTHWAGIPVRKDRRAVNTPAKMARSLLNYAGWAEDIPTIVRSLPRAPRAAYDELWREALALPGVGRYAATKILEGLRRYAEVGPPMYDHRPVDGWSPRTTIGLLEPTTGCFAEARDNGRGPAARALAAEETVVGRMAAAGLPLDRYRLEVMLCNYRVSVEGDQYPGRSADMEALTTVQTAAHWPDYTTDFWAAREATSPDWALGERQGWPPGTRKPLASMLLRHGYTWSDYLYKYNPNRVARPERHTRPDHPTLLELAQARIGDPT